ncbi:MAG: hypothetical protein PHS31_01980 [Victivallaceae bacterium]|nr:hypothetical protein [Victivallaceae bacterium]MDD4180241.1 hypothetical protein [Victivallaceae bacterium]
MASNRHNRNDWNEFRWEHEIRLDEKRIKCYFQELPCCIDLPGEEDYIMKKMSGMPDLVPSQNQDIFFYFSDDDDDDDEDDFFSGEWRHKKGAELYDQIIIISKQWNSILASSLTGEEFKKGMAATCLLGKIASRMIDILNSDAKMQGLKISLLKRVLSELNSLIGIIRATIQTRRVLEPQLYEIIEQLQGIREKFIDLLQELRGS